MLRTPRRGFLALVGSGALLASCGDGDDDGAGGGGAQDRQGDLGIVNYALTLEFIEAQFYEQVLDAGVIKRPHVLKVVRSIEQDEQEHVDALTVVAQQLGGGAAKAPKVSFDDVIKGGEAKVLATAALVENLGAAAYLGQAGRIENPEVLAAALSIHSNEGRHAAALNWAVGRPMTQSGAFAKPATMAEVLRQVKPFLVS